MHNKKSYIQWFIWFEQNSKITISGEKKQNKTKQQTQKQQGCLQQAWGSVFSLKLTGFMWCYTRFIYSCIATIFMQKMYERCTTINKSNKINQQPNYYIQLSMGSHATIQNTNWTEHTSQTFKLKKLIVQRTQKYNDTKKGSQTNL
jgi:hypothetical protein